MLAVDVLPSSLEFRVALDVEEHVQVSHGAPLRSRVSLPLDPELVTVVHSGWDLDLVGANDHADRTDSSSGSGSSRGSRISKATSATEAAAIVYATTAAEEVAALV